jgi:serine/threonine protein kinase
MEDETLNRITLYGGSFVGAGVSGCVIRPPLLCKGQTKVPDGDLAKIAKILEPNEAKHELAIAAELRKIPMSKNYFTYSDQKKACEPLPQEKQVDKDGRVRMDYQSGRCRAVLEYASLSYFRMFTMPNSGEPYTKKKYNLQNFDFWDFGKHLLEGLSLLLVHGIVHLDLHSNNVVIDDYMVPRIIDWGSSTQGPFATEDELKQIVIGRRFSLGYKQEPPEIPIFVAAYKGRPSIDTVIDEMFVARRDIVYDLQSVTGIDSRIVKEQLESFRNRTVFLERELNFVKWWKAHWHTYDIWGLGILLLKMLEQFEKRVRGFLDRPEYAEKKQKIISALRGMCNFNCFERLNAVQALAKWDGPNNHIIRRFGAKWL